MRKLRNMRINNNYTYEDMANLLDISKAYYWQIENKKRRLTYALAIKISSVFNLKPDDIFYEDFITK